MYSEIFTKIKYYFILLLKVLLLLAIIAISVEAVMDGWFYSAFLSWKIGSTLSAIILLAVITITWKITDFPEKWVIALIFPIVMLTVGTIIYGVETEGGPFIFSQGNPKLINILFMVAAVGLTILFILARHISSIIKIVLIALSIITIIGFTIPILLNLNLHQALQGQASSVLEALPFFLRPTFLGIFLFYPLMLVLLIMQVLVSLKNKETINRVKIIYPIIPVILLLVVGVRTLIISAPVEKVFTLNDFKEKKGRCNIASHAQGGYILDFKSQLDIYDDAVFNLIDGDIWQKGWKAEENTPFPQDITFALPGTKAQIIDQVIIYNAPNGDPTAVKEIAISVASSNTGDYRLIGNFQCQYTSVPQVFSFKQVSAKLVKISIYSNWGSPKTTTIKEIEISGPETQKLEINPLKGNLMDDNSGLKAIYYIKNGQISETIPYRIPQKNSSVLAGFQIEYIDLPSEIVFNLPESKTYIIDNLVLEFYPSENKPKDITDLKELEILISTDSPIDGFKSVGKFLCTKGKPIESFSFLPQRAKYIKLKFLSPMEPSKPIVIKDIELYQPMITHAKESDNNYQSGLQGMYFAGRSYKDFFNTRLDPTIDYSWGVKSPIGGMGSGNYSISWEGRLYVPENGYYELGLKSNMDDEFKFYLDNQLMIKKSDTKTEEWLTNKFRLTKGWYPIKIDYYHQRGDAMIKFAWKKPGESSLQIIDRKFLSHKVTDTKEERTPREAVQTGIDWMGNHILEWQEKNKCYSCHAQPSALITFSMAAKNDYKYNIEATMSVMDLIRSGINDDGSLSFPKADSLTALQFVGNALCNYDTYIENGKGEELVRISNLLVSKQLPQGNWKNDNSEPPLQQGDIMCTTYALLTLLQTYNKTKDAFFSAGIQKASEWLENASPQTTQDIVFQLIGLATYPSPNSEKVIQKDIEKLFNLQQEDGGWGEMEGYKSNSYSTGQVIYALKLAKVVLTNPNFSRGVEYLMKNQNVIGSWPSENTQSKRPSEIIPTMWAVMALSNSFESLMLTITKPSSDQTFSPKDPNENYVIETKVYNAGSGKISSVEFFIDDQSIGKIIKPPYSIKWEPKKLPGGQHHLMAILKCSDGKEVSDTKTIFVDKSIKIGFLNPKNDANPELSTKIQVEIKNQSNSPITKVEYYLDKQLITEVTKEPFETLWNTADISNGRHILKAKIYNEIGDTASIEEGIIINRKLDITLDKPAEGTIIEDNADLSSTVTNESGSPTTKVEYYLGDKLIGSSTQGPSYKYDWKVEGLTNGDYIVKAVTYNQMGKSANSSHMVSIAHSLKIKLANITEGMSLTGKKELSCTVQNLSNSKITEVIYYLDGRPIGKTNKEPYKIMWDTNEYASGAYTLRAVVYSASGGKSHSEVNIKIEHPINISLYTTVTTNDGKYVPGLKKGDFILEEVGNKQKILDLQTCNEKTQNSYCIMLDTGKHMDEYTDDMKNIVQKYLNSFSGETDSSVIVFADYVIKKEKLSKGHKDLGKIFSDIKAGGGTAIYDAALEGITLLKNSDKRKVLVLFTAGIDENEQASATASKHKLDDVLREASKANCMIYVIAIGSWADTFVLSDIADGTGGRAYSSPDPNGIEENLKYLNLDLACQYNIIYQSSNPVRNGKWRDLKFSIKNQPDFIVNSQKGYYAPEY